MKYRIHTTGRRVKWPKLILTTLAALLAACLVIGGVLWYSYQNGLKPVGGSSQAVSITIREGATPKSIATELKEAKLIRNAWAFEYYARWHHASQYLQAGTYEFAATQSVQAIIAQLTHGKVAVSLVTILPGQRLDQIRQSLIDQGFSAASVDAALEPTQYENSDMFASKPSGNNLEGYLYPDSFQRTTETTAKDIIKQSLAEFQKHLTSDITVGFAAHGLTTYQGIIIASIVEQEAVNQSDRSQAAQVFLKRLQQGMPLGSDVTAFYGSILAGMGKDVSYDTPHNTRIHTGLPPTPISNVSDSSLKAVTNPATTDWLYFVAGDDGTVYFSKTLQEHEALTEKYCHIECR